MYNVKIPAHVHALHSEFAPQRFSLPLSPTAQLKARGRVAPTKTALAKTARVCLIWGLIDILGPPKIFLIPGATFPMRGGPLFGGFPLWSSYGKDLVIDGQVSCASCVSAQGFLGSCVPRDLQPEDGGWIQ